MKLKDDTRVMIGDLEGAVVRIDELQYVVGGAGGDDHDPPDPPPPPKGVGSGQLAWAHELPVKRACSMCCHHERQSIF